MVTFSFLLMTPDVLSFLIISLHSASLPTGYDLAEVALNGTEFGLTSTVGAKINAAPYVFRIFRPLNDVPVKS